MERVLIIIPAYNEEKAIENTVSSVNSLVSSDKYHFDYLVINDCSKDNTLKVLEKNRFNYINLPCNLGIGGAVQTGYLYSIAHGYDYTVQIDGDGQHDPKYIEEIIKKLKETDADMAIGSRFITNEGFQSSGMRQIGIKIISFIVKILTRQTIRDVTSGYRVCNKKMTNYFSRNYADDYPEPEAIVSSIKNGYKVIEVPVVMNERESGKSSISGFKSIYYMVKVSLALLVSYNKRKDEYNVY